MEVVFSQQAELDLAEGGLWGVGVQAGAAGYR